MKKRSYFFHKGIAESIRKNIENNSAAADRAGRFLDKTEYWMNLRPEELSALIYSPELIRSWFVLSDGCCPVCRESVPMYSWLHDPMNIPWKMKCPHCSSLFPSNDFKSYYESGLDGSGRFSHETADRGLLVSEDGGFVIDDGNGWYDENGKRYMFIGAYLAHAQWCTLVSEGIFRLAFSHVLTGKSDYAVRAAILLHAVSRYWPEYDFFTQGLMYEQQFRSHGYVNYWVMSNNDARLFAMAYDQIFECIKDNRELENLKGINSLELCRNIEERILLDSLANEKKIHSNPPSTPITVSIIRTVLEYDEKSEYILEYIDNLIEQATRVDGLSGESGIGGYAAISPRAIADLICLYSSLDCNFLSNILEKHPHLYKTYRFHIDTWYDAMYYPGIGDNSVFAATSDRYTAIFPAAKQDTFLLYRSGEWFLMKLSEYFDDPDFAKTIYHSHGGNINGVFDDDLYISSPSEYENRLSQIIQTSGSSFRRRSVNYGEWRLSLLHTGSEDNKTLLAMPYSSGANHCHHDALGLHLFAKGINLTADFGYPPVNYGGWETKQVDWYRHPAAHNTVVIDKKLHTNLPQSGEGMFYRYPEYGSNILFAESDFVHAAWNDAHEYANAERFERLSILIDISADDCYCVDVFTAIGGNEHARFQRSTYSDMLYSGLNPKPGKTYDSENTIMRNFMTDEKPADGWYVDFRINDHLGVISETRNIHLRYIPLTPGVSATVCESWVDITRMSQSDSEKTGNREIWIPTLIEETKGGTTMFTGILEPYEDSPFIEKARVIKTKAPYTEIVEVSLMDGTTDLIIVNNPMEQSVLDMGDLSLSTDALLTVVRLRDGNLINATVMQGTFIEYLGNRFIPDESKDVVFI